LTSISFPEPSRALPDTLLTVEDVAERLAVSVGWVRDHAGRRTPALPVVRLGCLLRFRAADIDTFISKQAEAPAKRKGRRQ
jgi:excisionase family DNA binding protein